MKTFGIALIALGLALTVAPALAQETGETSFTLVSAQQGADYVWENTAGETNPTLVVPASTEITITIEKGDDTAGIPHNIQVGDGETSDTIADAGDTLDYTFTSPASGTVEYVCTIHPTTMKGTVQVAGSGDTGTNGEANGNDTPGLGALGAGIALVGAALIVARRK